jgi:hypothetical protein
MSCTGEITYSIQLLHSQALTRRQTLSTKGLFATFSITTLCYYVEYCVFYCYAECLYYECHYAQCRSTIDTYSKFILAG